MTAIRSLKRLAELLPPLKPERVNHRVYASRDQARLNLSGDIEGFQHSRRLRSALGYISSAEDECRELTPSTFAVEDQSDPDS